MKISQAWFIQTIDGKSYLIVINHSGTYVNLSIAIELNATFYGINITNEQGSFWDLVERITEKDSVTFKRSQCILSKCEIENCENCPKKDKWWSERKNTEYYTYIKNEIIPPKKVRFLYEAYEEF